MLSDTQPDAATGGHPVSAGSAGTANGRASDPEVGLHTTRPKLSRGTAAKRSKWLNPLSTVN